MRLSRSTEASCRDGGSEDVVGSGAGAGASMKRVFLSYAAENTDFAAQLAEMWRSPELEVFRFDDPIRRGGIIIEEIEREISAADAFVALMSPQYLASPWCQRERQLALHLEHELGRQFIYVFEVASTPREAAGMMRTYDWLDTRNGVERLRLEPIAERIRLGRPATTQDASTPGFRNRLDELATLLTALRTAGGRELWVVVSPPLMGKSWLLARLEQKLITESPRWSVRSLDLRHGASELRVNPIRLVGSLLGIEGLPEPGPLRGEDLRDIATAISARQGHQLFVLDSAELLTPACATTARAILTGVHRLVKRSGTRARLGLVVGTRRHDEWRGLGPDARTGQRFEPLRLSEFGDDIVHQALLDLPRDLGQKDRWTYAERLHRLSEGLPALLVKSVQWADRTAFLRMAESDVLAAFDEVARDYIQKDLLAAETLLPMSAPRPAETLAVLRSTLRVLSTYRLYTQSHLKFHLDTDPNLAQALGDAHWSGVDLWEALGHTALHTPEESQEVWHTIEPSLRRLLHRYHHPTDAERVTAHTAARLFYGRWTQDQAAGREQQVVLVECLWHEAVRLTIEQKDAVTRLLPGIAVELAQRFGSSPMYEPPEFTDAVLRRLRDDDELQLLLSGHEGLFEEVVKSVELTIGDGR